MMGNKITPAWGLIQKISMDPTENWRIPIYKPPKFTEKQEAAQQEAKKKKLRYKMYRPGEPALKEIKYYKYNAGFVTPISAIRRLCLEIGYDYKEKISFQLHAYKLLQEAVEWYLDKCLQRYKFASCTCQEYNGQHKRYGISKKSLWRLWATQHMGLEF